MRMFCAVLWGLVQAKGGCSAPSDPQRGGSLEPLSSPSSFDSKKSPGAVQARVASLVIASSSFVAIGGISEAAKPQV